MDYNISDYSITSDPTYDNALIIQDIIDQCSNSGGGRVIIPAGLKFMTGPFNLKSNVELYLQANSEILANPDETVYNTSAFRENESEGTIWIGGEGADNIAITGQGTLNAQSVKFMGKELKTSYELKPFTHKDPRPHLLTLVGCENVDIRDVTFKNSPYWCVHLAGCKDIVIDGIRILNSLKVRNSDGIDLDHSKNVRISNCYIESGDDCICLKNRREYDEFGDCENIVINNCIMTSTSCSFKIGSENVNRIRNVTISNCIINRSNRGIGIQNRDEGNVENILFENIIIESRLFSDEWWGKSEPIYITAFTRASGDHKDHNKRFAPGQKIGKVGSIRNIKFHNCMLKGENGIYIAGEEGKIDNIELNDITLTIDKITNYDGGFYDRRPCDGEGLIPSTIAGITLENITDIKISNCTVKWGENRPSYYGNPINQINVTGFILKDFMGSPANNKTQIQ